MRGGEVAAATVDPRLQHVVIHEENALAEALPELPRLVEARGSLERVRVGTWRTISRPRNALEATSSAKSTILPSVALSRALMRLLIAPALDFFFLAIVGYSVCGMGASPMVKNQHGRGARAT